MTLGWKMGFEIELLAPAGVTRAMLADRVAERHGGKMRAFFHPQSEPSKVPGRPTFENLTPGFEALDRDGKRIATFVDDITLQADLDRGAKPVPGWYRVVADDARLLRLVIRHCDPEAAGDALLSPLAKLFGTEPQVHESGMVRIVDDRDASVAISAPLPGERERPCEIVTAPLTSDHARILGELLDDACTLGFSVPVEGATHIHFDATPLLSARVIARLVALFSTFGSDLKTLVGANPNCVRLGAWPESLPALVETETFQRLEWPAAREALGELGLSKYCDFNLLNIAMANQAKHTFEVRILPSWLEAEPIIAAAGLFEGLLHWCCGTASRPATLAELIESLPQPVAQVWRV